jgi:hypothetical protein
VERSSSTCSSLLTSHSANCQLTNHMHRSGLKPPKSPNVCSSTSSKTPKTQAHSVSWKSGPKTVNGSRRNSSPSPTMPPCGPRVSRLGLRRYKWSTSRGREMETCIARSSWPKPGNGDGGDGGWTAVWPRVYVSGLFELCMATCTRGCTRHVHVAYHTYMYAKIHLTTTRPHFLGEN